MMSMAHVVLAGLNAVGYAIFRLLLTLLWQGSLVIMAALFVEFTLRNRAASIRHAVWIVALTSVPLLPLLSKVAEHAGAPTRPLPVSITYDRPLAVTQSDMTYSSQEPESVMESPVINEYSAPQVQSLPGNIPDNVNRRVNTTVSDANPRLSSYPWVLFVLFYGAAVAVFLHRIFAGYRRIKRWFSDGENVRINPMHEAFFEAARNLGILKKLRIAEHPDVVAPIAFGIFNPRILLPRDFHNHLDADELAAVALHEAAHLKRHDPQILLFVSLLRAVLCFHPLVWFAARRVAVLAEFACDDIVLESDIKPTPYARVLTRLAEELPARPRNTELAVGFVLSRSMFFHRVQAILTDERSRIRRMSAAALSWLALAGIAIVILAAGFPLGERKAAAEGEQTITGRVLHNGEPVAGAELFVNIQDIYHAPFNNRALKVGETGRDGRFEVTFDTGITYHLSDQYPTLAAVHPRYAVGWTPVSPTTDDVEIVLEESEAISGIVTDAANQPLAGATVEVIMIIMMESGQPMMPVNMFPGIVEPLTAVSGTDGSFRIDGLPAASGIVLTAASDGLVADNTSFAAGTEDIRISLEPTGAMTGRVVDETGDPIDDALIVAHGIEEGFSFPFIARTDAMGRYLLDGIPADLYFIHAVMDESATLPSLANAYIRDIRVDEHETTEHPDIVVTAGRVLAGRVVDADTGEPVPGVGIATRHPDNNFQISLESKITGTDGGYAFRISEGDAILSIDTVPEEYIRPYGRESSIIINDDEPSPNLEFRLKRGLTVRGRAVDPSGAPVSHASVSGEWFGVGDSNVWRGSTKAGDDGIFTIRGLADDTVLDVTISSSPRGLRAETTLRLDDPDVQVVTLEPYGTATLRGRVVDDSGNPMPGVGMNLSINYDGYSTSRKEADTDEEGRYSIENILIGRKYSLSAEKDGWAATGIPLPDLTADMGQLPDAVMHKAERWISGTILVDDGTPAVGVMVMAEGGRKRSYTDNEGNFRIDGLVNLVERNFALRHERYGYYTFTNLETNNDYKLTVYWTERSFRGRVVDSDGTALSSVRVIITPQRHESGLVYGSIETDANGRFRYDNMLNDVLKIQFQDGKNIAVYDSVRVTGEEQTFVMDEAHRPQMPKSSGWKTNGAPYVVFDQGTPDLNVERWISGEPVDLSRQQGKVVVIDFWNSEREQSLEDTRLLRALYDNYHDRGLVIVGIHAHTGDAGRIESLVREQGIRYPVAIDSEAEREGSSGGTFDAFGIDAMPFKVLIDRNGEASDVGIFNLEKKIRELFGEG